MAKKILLFDVNSSPGDIFDETLRDEGYEVIRMTDAWDAIDKLKQGSLKYDLLLVRCMVLPAHPDMLVGGRLRFGGEDVIDISKAVLPNVPVVSYSCDERKPDLSDAHMTMPIWPDEMLKVVGPFLA